MEIGSGGAGTANSQTGSSGKSGPSDHFGSSNHIPGESGSSGHSRSSSHIPGKPGSSGQPGPLGGLETQNPDETGPPGEIDNQVEITCSGLVGSPVHANQKPDPDMQIERWRCVISGQ